MSNAQGKVLIEIIKDNIEILDYTISRQKWRDAAYYAQQVLEKSLKLVLMSQGVPDKQILTHDINYLRMLLSTNFGIQVPSNVVASANKLTMWEAKSRYDLGFKANPVEVRACAKIAKEYFKLVTSNK